MSNVYGRDDVQCQSSRPESIPRVSPASPGVFNMTHVHTVSSFTVISVCRCDCAKPGDENAAETIPLKLDV